MKNDLTDMMKYISQLESYVYKMESIDDEQSNETDVDEASNEIDDMDVDETDVDDENMVQSNKDIDFIEIGNNVYLNKKTNKTYEIADDDDLNEDLF
jgi:hypothetical protein